MRRGYYIKLKVEGKCYGKVSMETDISCTAALHKTVRTSCKKMTPYVSQLNTGTIHNKIEVVYEFVASYSADLFV